ncbi:class I SAM-dependent methyltransferase [Flavobacterium sp.]|uniref:class I SAM-dependent methyltransferase n=1 Tax=Flavobacterium sp. TaxID=239 RepID=UPI0008BCA119|nr:class I SAM-dependent methyltransferase [Flavobacterium sp.]OGS64591.1 MAG: methyltransferase [Flavobacteria bacterium GWA2_35_26]HCF04067.1 SAM-dependent methyltransferase [Flavobacterium sp.]
MKDLFGKAILDYQTNSSPENIITSTSISDEDEMEVAYLFRSFDEMPTLEQKALQLAKGRTLEVGCGAGSHGLYLQSERNIDVYSIDISKNAIEACTLRGLKNTQVIDVLNIENEKYDTILLLMNGTGIFETLDRTTVYLQKLKSLLQPSGQILIDSSDIIYIFDEDEDGGKWIPSDNYYGELTFTLQYKNETEIPFPWLYLDFNTLQNAAIANGLQCQLVLEGDHFDYLAQLTLL